MRARRPDPEPRGSTLLEAVVALGIAALVLGGLYGALARAAGARRDATARADRTAAARTVLLNLVGELAAATRPPLDEGVERRFSLEEPPAGGPPWSTLRFPTLARATGDVRVVDYRVEADPRVGGTGTLVRRQRDVSDGPPVALLAGVRALRVRGSDGRGWKTVWAPGELPRAVDVVLAFDDGEGGTAELGTEVALPAAGR